MEKNPVAHVDLGFAKYFSGISSGRRAEFDQALTIDAQFALRVALEILGADGKAGQAAQQQLKLG